MLLLVLSLRNWHERIIAISLSVLVVTIIIKILPERPNQ
jgi:hypothetical protein